jgi:hypothetical protein
MEPARVEFERDWTYMATYRNGQCISRGHWYATVDEISAINLAGKCDDRPGTGGDQLTIEVIDDNSVLVNHDLYTPEDARPKRGIIWQLPSFNAVSIKIEYDMPIVAAMPDRFDVTMTNRSESAVTLERFSLTERFDNYGRNLGDTGKELVLPKELAAVDLGRVELAPGEAHQASLVATFAAAGRQWIYFNALISGSTQNWDFHQAHEMSIQE